MKVRFKDLSSPLKTVVIFSWIWIVLFVIYFIAGFVVEITGG